MSRLWYERIKAGTLTSKPRSASFVDAKLDGWLLDICVPPEAGAEPTAMTRRDDVWYKLKHLKWPWSIVKHMQPGTAVQGELYVPGRPASDVPKMLCADVHQLQFAAFAIPSYNGTMGEGLDTMDPFMVEAQLKAWQCKVVPRVELAKTTITAQDAHGVLEVMRKDVSNNLYSPSLGYAAITAGDIEGLVFKAQHYGDGHWWKYKESKLVDLIVIAIKPGEGKNMGSAGALAGGLWKPFFFCEACQRYQENELRSCDVCKAPLGSVDRLTEVASVGGMDDETRDNIGDDDVGRVFEAEYQYLGSGNKLRHPRFKRWRDDKPAQECTWNQVLEQRGI